MARVSVIIPAYNAAKTVGRAVDSVLAQTFADFELIVIDDGSTDSTAEVVQSRRDQRIRCITVANGGVASARNRGLDLASGDLVAFLDADDAWLPTKLERQSNLMMRRASLGLCFTSAVLVDDQLRQIGEDRAGSFIDYCAALLTVGNVVPGGGSSAIARRSAIDVAGHFDPSLSQCADWDLWLRLSIVTNLAPIDEALVEYRRGRGSMSRNPALLEKDTFALLDKFFATPESAPYHPLRRRAYGRQWMVCAGTYLHAGRVADSIRCAGLGIRADLRSVSRPLGFPVRLGFRLARKLLGRTARTRAGR